MARHPEEPGGINVPPESDMPWHGDPIDKPPMEYTPLPNPAPKLKKVLIKDVIAKLQKTHPGVIRDKEKAEAIPLDSQCRRCGGTGNELFAMYKRCQACGGDGITRHNESEFSDA